jgi:hypothetical protein
MAATKRKSPVQEGDSRRGEDFAIGRLQEIFRLITSPPVPVLRPRGLPLLNPNSSKIRSLIHGLGKLASRPLRIDSR